MPMSSSNNWQEMVSQQFARIATNQPQLEGYNPEFTLEQQAFETKKEYNAAVKTYKLEEIKRLEHFMATGTPNRLGVQLNSRGILEVRGDRIERKGSVLCLISPKLIRASVIRGKHLLKILETLAEREHLTLKVIDSLLEVSGGRTVEYWRWQETVEVDDSELVALSEHRPQGHVRHDEANNVDAFYELEYNPVTPDTLWQTSTVSAVNFTLTDDMPF